MKLVEIAAFVGGELISNGDAEITSVADISTAVSGQIAFFEKDDEMPATGASCVLCRSRHVSKGATVIVVNNPKLAFAKIAAILHPPKARTPEIHSSAIV